MANKRKNEQDTQRNRTEHDRMAGGLPQDQDERRQEGRGRGDRDQDSGQEASQGIRNRNNGGSERRPGSEPMIDRDVERKSGYGGSGGEPNRGHQDRDNPNRDRQSRR